MRPSAFALLLLAAPAHAATPSFDCSRAATPTEFAICDNEGLARLDVSLAEAYGAARDRPGVKDRQRAWIGERNRCGADVDCLSDRMRARLAELTGAPQPPGGGGAGGVGGFPAPNPPGAGTSGPTPPGTLGAGGGLPTPPGGGGAGGVGSFPAPPGGGTEGGPGLAIPGTGAPAIAERADDRSGAYCPDAATGFGFAPSGDGATISYATFLSNGHSCGTGPLAATREGTAFVNRTEGCTVTVTLTDTAFRLSASPEGACQQLYCGARAVISDTEIPFTSRSPVVRDVSRWNFITDGC